MRSLLLVIILLFLSAPRVRAQSFQAGISPEVAISYRWTDRLKQTVKIESMHEFFHTEPSMWNYSYDQTDLQVFLEGRLNPFIRIAGGYQFRLEGEGENSHRTIQQVAFLRKGTGFRLGHRLRTDQTFYPSETLEWRLRYRLSAEISLEGQSLDAGEFYLLLSGEPIFSWQNSVSDLETRLKTSLGYLINNSNKVEAGLDYRLDRWLENSVRQRLWVKVGWFYSI